MLFPALVSIVLMLCINCVKAQDEAPTFTRTQNYYPCTQSTGNFTGTCQTANITERPSNETLYVCAQLSFTAARTPDQTVYPGCIREEECDTVWYVVNTATNSTTVFNATCNTSAWAFTIFAMVVVAIILSAGLCGWVIREASQNDVHFGSSVNIMYLKKHTLDLLKIRTRKKLKFLAYLQGLIAIVGIFL